MAHPSTAAASIGADLGRIRIRSLHAFSEYENLKRIAFFQLSNLFSSMNAGPLLPTAPGPRPTDPPSIAPPHLQSELLPHFLLRDLCFDPVHITSSRAGPGSIPVVQQGGSRRTSRMVVMQRYGQILGSQEMLEMHTHHR